MGGRKHTSLNLKDKLNVINDFKKHNKEELCVKYKCSLTTINRILKNSVSITEQSKTSKLSSKRSRTGSCIKVERALLLWFNQMRESGAVISRNMICEKAKKFAVEFKEDFNPSTGWLSRWQKREGITLRKIQGEGASADVNAANTFIDAVLPNLLSKYEPSQIYNADESALFFKALPKSSLRKKGDQVKGFKCSKERLTLLFICNATGDHKEVIVIGKSKSPRCFKNKILPLKYYSQNKAWMTQEIWSKILLSLDAEMQRQERRIILFVDNASSHKTSATLSNIDLQYLPPNTTSIVQPLDQGIIHCFKSYYRQNLVRKQIGAIESGKTVINFTKSLNIFNALHMIKNSWWLVKPTTIANCFKKAKFISSCACSNTEENILEFSFNGEQQQEFENYVSFDDGFPCCGQLTDEEIVNEVMKDLTSDSSSEEEEDREVRNPLSTKDVLICLNNLREFFLPKNLFSHELDSIEKYTIEQFCKPQVQAVITDFFKPI